MRRKAGLAAAIAAVLLLLGWAGGAAAGVGDESAGSTPSSGAHVPEAAVTPSSTATAEAPTPLHTTAEGTNPTRQAVPAVPAETTAGEDEAGGQRPSASTAQALLETLPVKGRAPKTGYDRDEFGEAWADVDRNGCDTRNDILARDLDQVAFRSASSCRVVGGMLDDPYSGQQVPFAYGEGTSQLVPVDHVVSLSDAWQKAPGSCRSSSGPSWRMIR
ncbi:Excalibur domain-containing protein [Arthrobacter crystallopoietes BAB-32]|uniref:Excalibur domain-containing protein n=1 Tax=Arthrobacter crystallopoietes BAB-32 TaxID=1246476 RepID=N1V8Q9_9MICC|nr:hypothetical protein [Arthrobacter crystallopoietes]EMY34638.1 Excalibur domain-containing protein [Arthrobacter crystallopoietes BAB-32]